MILLFYSFIKCFIQPRNIFCAFKFFNFKMHSMKIETFKVTLNQFKLSHLFCDRTFILSLFLSTTSKFKMKLKSLRFNPFYAKSLIVGTEFFFFSFVK